MGIPVSELAWIPDLFLNSLFSRYKHQKGVGTNICNLTTWFMWRKSLIFGIKCVPISLPSAFPSSIQLCKIKYWYIIIYTHTARACIKNQTSNYAQKERENKGMLELINFSKKQEERGWPLVQRARECSDSMVIVLMFGLLNTTGSVHASFQSCSLPSSLSFYPPVFLSFPLWFLECTTNLERDTWDCPSFERDYHWSYSITWWLSKIISNE